MGEKLDNLIDNMYYEQLAEQKIDDVCRRSGCRFDKEKKVFVISAWGDEFEVNPHEKSIVPVGNHKFLPNNFFDLFLVYYLVNSKAIEVYNSWISEKDIVGGATFFRGPHEIPTNQIAMLYKDNLGDFRKACEHYNGIQINMGDAAYYFKITSRIPVAVLFWKGDEDFPPESKIMFDKSITEHLTTDIVFSLAVAVCARVGTPV